MYFRQLHPAPGTVEIGEHITALGFARRAPAHRPFTVVNFVSSVDGRSAFRGRSGALGDDGDLAVFRTLRREVDGLLVGTGTLRTERYGRLVADPRARERRRRRGLEPEPLACLVTRSGDVPFDIPLFAEPEARVVIFSCVEIEPAAVAAQVQVVVLAPGEPALSGALRRLRIGHGVRALLCEGGPALLRGLVGEAAVDELFLTLAPKLTGEGTNPSMLRGAELPEIAALSLEGVLERHGSLFLRYATAG